MPRSLDAPLGKRFKTHGDQIALLRERGMLIESDLEACWLLERVNYYRLSGYWYSWRKLLAPGKRADSFVAGTTLADVAAVYMFDCRLRETVFACLAPIELSVRSMLGHELGRVDPFAHIHPNVLGPLAKASDGEGSSAGYQKWLARYEKELRASREDFVAHHKNKYGGRLPIWAAVEVMDWGSLTYLYQLAPIGVREVIAARVDLTAAQFGGLVGLGACGLVVAGMAWLGARVYDPDTFSFLSPDPLADPPAGVLWASNPYGYAANNPLVFSDPAGYKPVTDSQLRAYNQNRARSGMAVAGDFVSDNWEYVAAAAAIAGGVALMATGVGGPAGIALMAASGALLSGGVSIGVQKYSTGNVDWTRVGQDSAVGAVTGLIGGSGFAAGKAVYVANSAAGNTSKALLTSFSINAASVLLLRRQRIC